MILTRTPFRISFFGGGTDYPAYFDRFGVGSTLSTTIDKYCYITCRSLPPFFDTKSRVVWSKIELVNHPDEIEHPTVRETLKHLDINDGIEIHHYGDLPAMSGMGSSSSFVVGLLNALSTLQGREMDKRKLALDAIHIEHVRAKQNVGYQDQVAAAYGGFNRTTYGGPERINVRPVAVSPEVKTALQDRLMMFFTGLSRTASEIAAEQIKTTAEKERELRRILSLVDEAERSLGSLKTLDEFGKLLHETWMLKRTLTSSISNLKIDNMYEAARNAGALGGKLLGAGGGGFLLFYVPLEKQDAVRAALKDYLNIPFRFEDQGSQVIYNVSG